MHDELKWNKVFGAVLATGLAILALRQVVDMGLASKPPKKPGYTVAIQETGGDSGGAEVADTLPDWGTVLPTADVAAGATISAKCQSCHNFAQGGPNETGPNLWGVEGRDPGTHPGFAYSTAMIAQGKAHPQWTYDELYKFLAGPQSYITGTKMSFVGLKKREDRINIIAWLRVQEGGTLPIPAPDKTRAAGAAPAGAAGSAPAPNAANTVAAVASPSAPVAVNGAAPVSSTTSSSGGVTPSSGAAAAPSKIVNADPGGPPNAGTTIGGSKALAAKPK